MEPEGSLPHSQVPATCPYPDPDNPVHATPSHFLKIYLKISSHLHQGLPSGFISSDFPTKTPLLSPIRATYPAHLTLLDFITRTILGEKCRSSCNKYIPYALEREVSYLTTVPISMIIERRW